MARLNVRLAGVVLDKNHHDRDGDGVACELWPATPARNDLREAQQFAGRKSGTLGNARL
ncbi:excalibur calcium-binding domain-containing protein [Bradyrhizobium sp. KB893862 SZCCT0404]|nr:excalibur calcium-binding domain-containing protein [Bradyrhizobium sp. KB893862 SZCCT0404]